MNVRRKNLLCGFAVTLLFSTGIQFLPALAAVPAELKAEYTGQNLQDVNAPDTSTSDSDTAGENVQGDGWQSANGKKYYYSNGSKLIGMQDIESKTYYFDLESGEMQTGFQKIKDQTYYFSLESGEMQTGMQDIEGAVYYFSPENGEMQIGFQDIDGIEYYFSPDNGEMQTGKLKIGKNVYYYDEDGIMQTGWITLSGKKYYFSPDNGEMQTGKKKINGKTYYFNDKGVLKTSGWIKAGTDTYYSNKKGVLQSGIKVINGNSYYFSDKNYKMQTGWKKINGKKYYFETSGEQKGVMLKGCIAGNQKAGYGYVDDSGIKVTASEVTKAVKFVVENTDLSLPSDVKLSNCFSALWNSCTYQRFYEAPTAQSMPGYADYMFTYKRGNCFRYAASFAYIAKVLGYESRVNIGSISSARGGMTPHGWTEVRVNGVWYMCDANMQRNHPNINSYMRTDANYRYRHTRSEAFVLTFWEGQVFWA